MYSLGAKVFIIIDTNIEILHRKWWKQKLWTEYKHALINIIKGKKKFKKCLARFKILLLFGFHIKKTLK